MPGDVILRPGPGSRRGPAHMGVDVGTSMTKAAVFDERGEVIAVASCPVRLSRPAADRVEQDPEAVITSVAEVMAGARRTAGVDTPDLVAITGQGDGCWLVDEHGHAVRPAVSWQDGRAAPLLKEWERDGVTDAVYRINGNALFPGCQAAVLRWLDEHEPDALDRAATAAYCKDVVFQRLTGLRVTDTSDASSPFGDGDGGYSDEVLELTGLGHRRSLLAPVADPPPSGRVTGSGAGALGLPEGTEVVGGPFDLLACAVGGGLDELGEGLLVVGTTMGCEVLVDRIDVGGVPAGMHLATPVAGRFSRALPAMVGCAALDWTLGLFGLAADSIDGCLATTRPGAGGVEMVPYLAPSGERAPFVHPGARGQLTGLSLTSSRADIVRATCEGLAFAARHCFEVAGLTGRVVACGGGTRSPLWLRIFATVLGRPLQVAQPDVGARGVVLAGLAATGRDHDAAAWTRAEAVVEPVEADRDLYEEGYRRYLDHLAAARPFWRT